MGEDPFFVSEFRQGSKIARIKRITGTSEDINVRTSQLYPLEKFVLKRYAESITKKPMSEKTATKFFKKESDFTRSLIETTKKTEINLRDRTLKLLPEGRRTDFNIGITRTKPLFETPIERVFTSETLFKDISNVLARASGKTPKLKGKIGRASCRERV